MTTDMTAHDARAKVRTIVSKKKFPECVIIIKTYWLNISCRRAPFSSYLTAQLCNYLFPTWKWCIEIYFVLVNIKPLSLTFVFKLIWKTFLIKNWDHYDVFTELNCFNKQTQEVKTSTKLRNGRQCLYNSMKPSIFQFVFGNPLNNY